MKIQNAADFILKILEPPTYRKSTLGLILVIEEIPSENCIEYLYEGTYMEINGKFEIAKHLEKDLSFNDVLIAIQELTQQGPFFTDIYEVTYGATLRGRKVQIQRKR